MAVVTDANPTYHGSPTLDMDLIEAAGLQRSQKILVANASNAYRAAALLGNPGDKIIIMAFCSLTPEEAVEHQPTVVHVSAGNRPVLGAAAPEGVAAYSR